MSECDEPASRALVSVLTPAGRSAVALVRVQAGPEIFDQPTPLLTAANGRCLAQQSLNRLCYGRWGDGAGEDVVVCRITPTLTEVSCHGGLSAVARIVRDLKGRGCRDVDWRNIDGVAETHLQAECRDALTRATTLRTAAILLEQNSGLLEQSISAMLTEPADEWADRIDVLLEWADFGIHLTQPWKVSLVGVPNVGKSSLMNALLGYGRSIVFAQPGTTRDVVTAVTAFDGWPVELSDTAGLRAATNPIEAEGVSRAQRQSAAADLTILVLDRSRPVMDEERRLIAVVPRPLIAANKSDLAAGWGDDAPDKCVHVSAATGEGIAELSERIAAALVPVAPTSGSALPVTPRQIDCLRSAAAALQSGNIDAARGGLQELVHGQEPSQEHPGQFE